MSGQEKTPNLKKPTVAAAANQCLEAFQQCLVVASSIHPRELSMVEDQLARFSSWANGIGVFALGSASMDHRLRYTPEVQGIVIALLESLGYRIKICLNTLDALIKSPIVEPSNLSNKQLGRTFLDIAAEITGLNKISNTIRRASNETQLLKASNFTIKDDEGTNIEPTLLHHFQRHIGDWFPDVSDNIQQRLARAMLLRRKRILYRRYRQGGHAIRPEPTAPKVSVVLPDAQLAEQPAGQVNMEQQSSKTTTKVSKSTVTASHVRSATTLAAEKFRMMASAPSVVSTSRTIASGKHQALVYPPAPGYAAKRRYEQFKAKKVAEGFDSNSKPTLQELLVSHLQTIGEIACPYCLCVLPAVEVFNERKWQNHVKNDLDAYVCLFEDCTDADTLYTHSHEWLDHSHQHARVWRCTSHREIGPFATAEEFKQHLRETHKGTHSESKLSSMADRSSRKTNKLFQSCPLCGKAESDVDGRLEDHITGHLRSLALKSLPPYQDEIPDDVTDNDKNSVDGSRPRSRSTLRDEMEANEGEQTSWDDWEPQLILTQYHASDNFLGDAHTTLDLSNHDVWDASMFFDRLVFKDLRRFAKELTADDLEDPILQTMVQHQGHRVVTMAEPGGIIITRNEETGVPQETTDDDIAKTPAPDETESGEEEAQQSVNVDETSDDNVVGSSNTDSIAFAHMGAWMESNPPPHMISEEVDVSDDDAYKAEDTNIKSTETGNTLTGSNLELVDNKAWYEQEEAPDWINRISFQEYDNMLVTDESYTALDIPHYDNNSDGSNWWTAAVHHKPPQSPLQQTPSQRDSSSKHWFEAPTTPPATTTDPALSPLLTQPNQYPIEPLAPESDTLGPKIWTGTHFLPRYVRSDMVDGELSYFYDDGTQCKSVIDGEPVNPHWGVTRNGKPRKRLAVACLTCREKKIKCDPDYPSCVQCDKFGRVCKFRNAPRVQQQDEAASQESDQEPTNALTPIKASEPTADLVDESQTQSEPKAELVLPDSSEAVVGYVWSSSSSSDGYESTTLFGKRSKPYLCDYVSCPRNKDGFSTKNDLIRHKRSVHKKDREDGLVYVCPYGTCPTRREFFGPRADNFRSHLSRLHNITLTAQDDLSQYKRISRSMAAIEKQNRSSKQKEYQTRLNANLEATHSSDNETSSLYTDPLNKVPTIRIDDYSKDSASIAAPKTNDDDELYIGELSDVQIARIRSRDQKLSKILDNNPESKYYSDDDENYKPIHRQTPAIVIDEPNRPLSRSVGNPAADAIYREIEYVRDPAGNYILDVHGKEILLEAPPPTYSDSDSEPEEYETPATTSGPSAGHDAPTPSAGPGPQGQWTGTYSDGQDDTGTLSSNSPAVTKSKLDQDSDEEPSPMAMYLKQQESYRKAAAPISANRTSTAAWTPSDDRTLIASRISGLNWSQIRENYFPSKSPNACRKRHERLMERRNTDEWDNRDMQHHASQSQPIENSTISSAKPASRAGWTPSDSLISRDKAAQSSLQKEPSSASIISKGASITLPCEFSSYTGCEAKFGVDETTQWINHMVSVHLHFTFPHRAVCWFCDSESFVAASDTTDSRREAYYARMQHVSDHIRGENMTIQDIRPDFWFLDHIHTNGLIDEQTYKQFTSYNEINHWFHRGSTQIGAPATTKQPGQPSVIVEEAPRAFRRDSTATPKTEPTLPPQAYIDSARLEKAYTDKQSKISIDDRPLSYNASRPEHSLSEDEAYEQLRQKREARRGALVDLWQSEQREGAPFGDSILSPRRRPALRKSKQDKSS